MKDSGANLNYVEEANSVIASLFNGEDCASLSKRSKSYLRQMFSAQAHEIYSAILLLELDECRKELLVQTLTASIIEADCLEEELLKVVLGKLPSSMCTEVLTITNLAQSLEELNLAKVNAFVYRMRDKDLIHLGVPTCPSLDLLKLMTSVSKVDKVSLNG